MAMSYNLDRVEPWVWGVFFNFYQLNTFYILPGPTDYMILGKAILRYVSVNNTLLALPMVLNQFPLNQNGYDLANDLTGHLLNGTK